MAAIASESRRSFGLASGLATMVVAAGGLLATVRAEPVMTEVTALARAYGAGVHAYFSGDAQRAYDDLTQAIEAGTRDPRAWYFRGLAALKLGRLDEAEADFSTAATRETEAVGDWGVGRSLERVQGHDRLALERHRVRARVAGLEQRRQAIERRYSDIESRQEEVQRQRRPEGVSPDPVSTFGGEELPATPPSAPAEEVVTPEPADGVREPAAEDAPAEPEPVTTDEPEMDDPAMEEAPPAPETTPEPPAEAETTPEAAPAADAEKPATEVDAPAEPEAPSDPADEAMEEKADEAAEEKADEAMEEKGGEGEPPAPADAPGSKVFDE